MEKVIKKILIVYYSVYSITILMALIIFLNNTTNAIIDSKSELGIFLTQFAILFLIFIVPFSLGLFHQKTKKWSAIEDRTLMLINYQKGAILRLIFIGSSLIINIILFYLLKDVSLIFCAGISAIALIFCKPSVAKMTFDLKLQDPEN